MSFSMSWSWRSFVRVEMTTGATSPAASCSITNGIAAAR